MIDQSAVDALLVEIAELRADLKALRGAALHGDGCQCPDAMSEDVSREVLEGALATRCAEIERLRTDAKARSSGLVLSGPQLKRVRAALSKMDVYQYNKYIACQVFVAPHVKDAAEIQFGR